MQVIYADDLQTVNEIMYGARSDALLNDLRSGLQQYDHSILTDLGRRYQSNVEQNFEAVSGWKVVNATRKAVAAASGFDAPSVILPIFTPEAMRAASLSMQRFLMADTEIRQMFHKHRIDGWSDTYVDTSPKLIGADHYDHRVSMHGVVERHEAEEGNVSYSVTEYKGELKPWDKPLSTSERLDIRRSAMYLRSKLKKGLDDLTSLYEGEVS